MFAFRQFVRRRLAQLSFVRKAPTTWRPRPRPRSSGGSCSSSGSPVAERALFPKLRVRTAGAQRFLKRGVSSGGRRVRSLGTRDSLRAGNGRKPVAERARFIACRTGGHAARQSGSPAAEGARQQGRHSDLICSLQRLPCFLISLCFVFWLTCCAWIRRFARDQM